jgi:hypothetical protein
MLLKTTHHLGAKAQYALEATPPLRFSSTGWAALYASVDTAVDSTCTAVSG